MEVNDVLHQGGTRGEHVRPGNIEHRPLLSILFPQGHI